MVAFQILALNIEKAHNLREKSLEVHRMYVELARIDPRRREKEYELRLLELQLVLFFRAPRIDARQLDVHAMHLSSDFSRSLRFLDAVEREDLNGNHRLTAMKELGAKTILALLIPEPEVAFQILALNIEKAHNLREKSLEVHRMYGELTRTIADAAKKSMCSSSRSRSCARSGSPTPSAGGSRAAPISRCSRRSTSS